MTNIKISQKGKALLQKKASAKVARALVRDGNRLSSSGTIQVQVDGKTITIKASAA